MMNNNVTVYLSKVSLKVWKTIQYTVVLLGHILLNLIGLSVKKSVDEFQKLRKHRSEAEVVQQMS